MNQRVTPTLLTLLLLIVFLSSAHSMASNNAAMNNEHTMSNEYAIVFLFQGSCRYCHQFSPSVMRVSQTLSLPVYGFSLDGGGVPGFEVPITATPEIRRTFMTGVGSSQVVPATFLINVNSRKFARISSGLVSDSVLSQGLSNAMNDPTVREALQ
ncbi:conjugal transfer protein TraF [Vibrio pectenicida]|uniref:conjugal transfer protein TraF n=1 Tax=Vibrio pectenicida TaxID=62763 RepID=UPI003B9C9769